jgi:hypothetical protein
MQPSGLPGPGWYDDPHDEKRFRYWNGRQWTTGVTNEPASAQHLVASAKPLVADLEHHVRAADGIGRLVIAHKRESAAIAGLLVVIVIVIAVAGSGSSSSALTNNSSCRQYVNASYAQEEAYIATLSGLDLSVINPDGSRTNDVEAADAIAEACSAYASFRLGNVVAWADGQAPSP